MRMPKDPLSKELFGILACPVCKGSLKYNEKKTGLSCSRCKHIYAIRKGIPILMPPEK